MSIRDSQNFIKNKRLVAELVRMSNICSNDVICEVGPGKGIITEQLIEIGHKVIAIEMDSHLTMELTKKFSGTDKLKIICGDFLDFNLGTLGTNKLFANIPFNITADIMSVVLSTKEITDAYLVMQYEAFLKYSGKPFYEECLKSLLVKPEFRTELLYTFKPTDFNPVPSVRIVFAHFSRKSIPDIEDYSLFRDFIAYLFLSKGDTLQACSKSIFSYEQTKRIWRNLGLQKECSLTNVSYEQWLKLFYAFCTYVPNEKKKLVEHAYSNIQKSQANLMKIHRNRNKYKHYGYIK